MREQKLKAKYGNNESGIESRTKCLRNVFILFDEDSEIGYFDHSNTTFYCKLINPYNMGGSG